jgi:DNA-binding transcriptional LysR family regulator
MIENFRIRVFRSVAQHLNFSRAAEELLLTQPAVTQQVKALEEELGIPLFDRGGGHIRLTPGGTALLPFAERLRELSAQTIGQYLLPKFVADFAERHPKVRIAARSGNTEAMLEALLAHEIQLALIEGPDQRRDLHIEPFMDDHMVLVVPASHEWGGTEITMDALRNEPMLVRELGSGSRRVIEQALHTAGFKSKDLQIRMELDSTEGLLSAVEAGLGVTFVSRWAVRNQLALGTLKLAHVTGLKLSRRFSLAYAAGPEPGGSVGAFRSFLLSQPMHFPMKLPARAGGPGERVSNKT